MCRGWGEMGWERCVFLCEYVYVSVCVGRGKEWLMDVLFFLLGVFRDKEKGEVVVIGLNIN